MTKKTESQEKFKTMIGGQALIEGIMMRGPEKQSIVVRSPEGLVVKTEPLKLATKKHPVLGWPLIRGVVNFGASMACGVKALMYSAEFFPEEEGEPSKFDQWLEEKLGSEKMEKAVISFSLVLGVLLAVGLFVLLPTFLAGLVPGIHGNYLARNLTEGLLKIALFMGYMVLVSRMKDMKRVFSYHGAEHKTIRCYEAKLPLTVENVRAQTRLHPRCGTSFLLVVMVISILVFSIASSALLALIPSLAAIRGSGLYRVIMILFKLLLLPLVVGITYEINRWAGRHDNWFTRIITAPGMWMQHFTTNEPDDSMIEVGIAAVTAVLPEKEGSDLW